LEPVIAPIDQVVDLRTPVPRPMSQPVVMVQQKAWIASGIRMVSAITAKRHMRFMIKESRSVNADVCIEFLVGATQKIFRIVDRGAT
jgi:hypothetical protein